MSQANDITYLKGKGVEYWKGQPVQDRLDIAEWHGDIGFIYHGVVRIYTDRQGNLRANKR